MDHGSHGKAHADAIKRRKQYNRYPVKPSKPGMLGVKEQTIPLSNVPSRGQGKVILHEGDKKPKMTGAKPSGPRKGRGKKR